MMRKETVSGANLSATITLLELEGKVIYGLACGKTNSEWNLTFDDQPHTPPAPNPEADRQQSFNEGDCGSATDQSENRGGTLAQYKSEFEDQQLRSGGTSGTAAEAGEESV